MARDWGVGMWLVKLDIRKAFDSVWQHSMSELVGGRWENAVGGDALVESFKPGRSMWLWPTPLPRSRRLVKDHPRPLWCDRCQRPT